AYRWQHDGEDIPGETGDVLVGSGLSPSLPDSGEYSVVVTNAHGYVTSAPATVLPDADRDGRPDAWGLLHFGNLSQTAHGDFDGDLVSNWDEWQRGTSPATRDYFLTGPGTWFQHTFAYQSEWTLTNQAGPVAFG